MQEEVENKTLTLIINGSKLTGRMLQSAIAKYLAHRKEAKHQKRQTDVVPHGKQTVKQLVGQDQGVVNVELTDPSIKDFERIARKYGVDYAIKRNRHSNPPKFLIFFKSRDSGALEAALKEYSEGKVRKASRPSVLQRLAMFKDMVKDTTEKVRKKVLER